MTTDDTNGRDSTVPDSHPMISIGPESRPHVKVWTLPDGVVTSVLSEDGATVTVILQHGEMHWTLSYRDIKWAQTVLYRGLDGTPLAKVKDEVVIAPQRAPSETQPTVVYTRPEGRLQSRRRRASSALTIDQATGAAS